jgi:hypothetical protein
MYCEHINMYLEHIDRSWEHAAMPRELRRHVPFIYSRAWCSFSHFAIARDDCAAKIAAKIARSVRAMHTPTPITCADCPNQCLYQ